MGQKPPLKKPEVEAIRTNIVSSGRARDLALFNLALDSKLRGCDLVAIRRLDLVFADGGVRRRTTVLQQKTSMPVRFELSERTRHALNEYLSAEKGDPSDWVFPGRWPSTHITTRQYARLVDGWIAGIGLEPSLYGTHSLRRTKVAHLYRATGNIRAVQLLLGHANLDHTVRYLGFDLEDALALSEDIDL